MSTRAPLRRAYTCHVRGSDVACSRCSFDCTPDPDDTWTILNHERAMLSKEELRTAVQLPRWRQTLVSGLLSRPIKLRR